MEKRREPRVAANLLIRLWGMDADSHPFFQSAEAHDISSQGAKLSRIEHQLTPGDVIGVQLGATKARYRVVWVIDAGHVYKIQAGVQLVEGQPCPWAKELTQAETPPPPDAKDSTKNYRRFERLKLRFPLELRDKRGGSRMQTSATDVSGRGCYIETLLPLPRGTELSISFWIESERVDTTAIVRACDGGVGMGIDFTGRDMQSQERLQRYLEQLERETKRPGDAPPSSPDKAAI
jgi:hypothetical protein